MSRHGRSSITYREPRVGREAKCVSSSLHHQTTTKNSALTMPNGLPSKAGLFDLRPSTASIAVANVDGGWARPGLSPGYTFLRDGAERHWPRLGGVVPSSWWTPSVASCRAAGGPHRAAAGPHELHLSQRLRDSSCNSTPHLQGEACWKCASSFKAFSIDSAAGTVNQFPLASLRCIAETRPRVMWKRTPDHTIAELHSVAIVAAGISAA